MTLFSTFPKKHRSTITIFSNFLKHEGHPKKNQFCSVEKKTSQNYVCKQKGSGVPGEGGGGGDNKKGHGGGGGGGGGWRKES